MLRKLLRIFIGGERRKETQLIESERRAATTSISVKQADDMLSRAVEHLSKVSKDRKVRMELA